jgi:cation diffusion facilitator CzcD-associated flavoprotein CzcO
MENRKKKRVCIIGGGAAGLVTLRHVKESGTLSGTLFEMSGNIGGVWIFDNKTAMYKGLK